MIKYTFYPDSIKDLNYVHVVYADCYKNAVKKLLRDMYLHKENIDNLHSLIVEQSLWE